MSVTVYVVCSSSFFNPQEWLASNFSLQNRHWIKYGGYEKKGNDRLLKKFLIVKHVLLVIIVGDARRTVWRICTLMSSDKNHFCHLFALSLFLTQNKKLRLPLQRVDCVVQLRFVSFKLYPFFYICAIIGWVIGLEVHSLLSNLTNVLHSKLDWAELREFYRSYGLEDDYSLLIK